MATTIKNVKVSKIDNNKRSKKWNVNKPRRGAKNKNSGIKDGDTIDKKTIKIGRILPDILTQDVNRECYIYRRADESIIDECVRQKVKKTLDEEMLRLGITKKVYYKVVREPVVSIKNIVVNIIKTKEKGWVIIIKRKTSFDVIRDTGKIVEFLGENGVFIKDEDICTGSCPLTTLEEDEDMDQ